MFQWVIKDEKIAQNAIFLEDAKGQEGRPFKARFLQAGLVKYDYGVCLLKKETIDKFVNTFVDCPVIIDHSDNINPEDVKGRINKIWFSPEDGWFWCGGTTTAEDAIKLIEDGYNVSCQYRITNYEDNLDGKLHNGNPYDKEILDGIFEHLAIVKNPRYEGAFIAVNAIMADDAVCKNGGDGSGNFDHEGRPGEIGGSSAEGGTEITEWGKSYKEYSGKPKEAIEHLLNVKGGYVPAAITKEGIGDIDFVYGEPGPKGYGFAHIISQRKEQGIDGVKLIRSLPDIIQKGEVISKENHTDRKYIVSDNKEVVIRLDYNGEKHNWIVSAYIKNELQGSNSLENWHTMLALDSNLSVVNGYVSITTPVTNSITDIQKDFNPNVNKYNSVFEWIRNYKKGESMDKETKNLFSSLIEALKARNEAEEDDKEKDCDKEADNKAKNEKVDKRDIIRQIMAIAGEHEDNEDVRTIAKLAEKLAYDDSEAGTADNGKAKNEEDEDEKKDCDKEKDAENKCKNEDEDKLYDELKDKVEKAAENKKAKNALDEAVNRLYSALTQEPHSEYISEAQGLELGKKIYG